MNSASCELSINELDAVSGGNKCEPGTGKCGGGEPEGMVQLRQIEGGLIDAGKAVASSLLSILT